tara:strand:+ start:212 stop:538 length:327 start_codon:yes stop_codon:yes gene_type:complete
MNQIAALKEEFEVALETLMHRLDQLKASIEIDNSNEIINLDAENSILKIQISEMQNSTNKIQLENSYELLQNNTKFDLETLEDTKKQHFLDLQNVQNILKQLKPLVEE